MKIQILGDDSFSSQARTYAEYRLFAALSQMGDVARVRRACLVLRRAKREQAGDRVSCTVTVEADAADVLRIRTTGDHAYAAINRAVERLRDAGAPALRHEAHTARRIAVTAVPVLPSILRASAPADVRERFVIAPHHPDRLARPAPGPGAIERERFEQALTWNVFRTLELLSPAFWLRRFHLRFTGEASLTAPQMLRVGLWRSLPLPPIQRIDGGSTGVLADVVIETEHSVWTLAMARDPESWDGSDRAAALLDAGSWLAGTREHYCGVIEADVSGMSLGTVLTERHRRSRESVRLRSASRGPVQPAATTWGVVGWPDAAAVLRDCCDAPNLPPIERALARNAIDWLRTVGIDHP